MGFSHNISTVICPISRKKMQTIVPGWTWDRNFRIRLDTNGGAVSTVPGVRANFFFFSGNFIDTSNSGCGLATDPQFFFKIMKTGKTNGQNWYWKNETQRKCKQKQKTGGRLFLRLMRKQLIKKTKNKKPGGRLLRRLRWSLTGRKPQTAPVCVCVRKRERTA